jgi:hypothetical protein
MTPKLKIPFSVWWFWDTTQHSSNRYFRSLSARHPIFSLSFSHSFFFNRRSLSALPIFSLIFRIPCRFDLRSLASFFGFFWGFSSFSLSFSFLFLLFFFLFPFFWSEFSLLAWTLRNFNLLWNQNTVIKISFGISTFTWYEKIVRSHMHQKICLAITLR